MRQPTHIFSGKRIGPVMIRDDKRAGAEQPVPAGACIAVSLSRLTTQDVRNKQAEIPDHFFIGHHWNQAIRPDIAFSREDPPENLLQCFRAVKIHRQTVGVMAFTGLPGLQ